jgi:electron transfer flavoprotein beta subunit
MDIIICIKRVPDAAEAKIEIDESGRDIKKEGLAFDINESDNYALEEALLLTERFGGEVTLLTVGEKESEEVLRMGLAKGAHRAIRLWDPKFSRSDGYATARVLAAAIKEMKYDLILTGSVASDDGYTQVGPCLAELLGVPHATLVTKIEVEDGICKVNRELEGGLNEIVKITLPALLTIQTGINKPRYASMMGIKRASRHEIEVKDLKALGLSEDEVGEVGSKVRIRKLFIPEVTKRAQILEGSPEEVAKKLAQILKERGLL